jgi:hypothetical protein
MMQQRRAVAPVVCGNTTCLPSLGAHYLRLHIRCSSRFEPVDAILSEVKRGRQDDRLR